MGWACNCFSFTLDSSRLPPSPSSLLNPNFFSSPLQSRSIYSALSSSFIVMDRINSLPDELLCHVFSFLPTKDAALTSVLSKRWLNLWKLVPNLDIDDSVFLHPEDGKGEREEIRQSFVNFVDSVLPMQGDSPIKNFSLKCITCVHPSIVKRWIRNVLQRGVLDLNLDTRYCNGDLKKELTDLPKEMFLSSTLVKLKITSENWVDLTSRPRNMDSFFPMLKSLDIESSLISFGKIEEFIPCLPVLEELRMANTRWENWDVTVSSASLKKLNLDFIGRICWEGFVDLWSFSIDTPNLLFLNYSELVAADYPLVNMGNLLEARIDLIVTDNDMLEEADVLPLGNVMNLMNGIKNVQRLTLSSDTLEVLSQCTESIPVFNNLKFLDVSSEEGRKWQAIPVVLRNCPHLETIIMGGLLHSVTDKCGDACPCISREDKGRSLTTCPVNRLEIKGFRATMKEMNMIKHFLDYFPCLKRLDVFIYENDHKQHLRNREDKVVTEMFDIYNKLSPGCNVQLLVE